MAAAESLENIASDSDNLLQKGRKSWPSGVVNFLEGTDNIDFLKEVNKIYKLLNYNFLTLLLFNYNYSYHR